MKKRPLLIAASVLVLALAGAGALMLAYPHVALPFAGKTPAGNGAKQPPIDQYRYVTLDKLIVMLRDPNGTRSHYLSMDLVFSTASVKGQKQIHDQLPMLRSVAYRALSGYAVEDARRLTVDDYTTLLMGAYAKAYGSPASMPFSNVLIGKLMLE